MKREIIGILSGLGFVIAVFKLCQIGYMFMFSGLSKKSDAKAALIPWLVGALVCMLFGSLGPWAISLFMGDTTQGPFDI